jgi:ribA/ribD-fused uncharacterized protein
MNPRGAKRARVASDVVFFWKTNEANGWLSNWSLHGFVEDEIKFETAEHYIMYHKALTMGDPASAQRVLDTNTPTKAKNIGRQVANWDEAKWEGVRETIVGRALRLKVDSYPLLKASLLSTHQKVIAEASPRDAIWGIGCSKTDPRARDPQQWPGLNLLGKAWMRVREEIANENSA